MCRLISDTMYKRAGWRPCLRVAVVAVETEASSVRHLMRERERRERFWLPDEREREEWVWSAGTCGRGLGQRRQGDGTLAVVVHDVIEVFVFQVHFLGAADLSQFGRPLSQSLWVGAARVLVDLWVSGVELSRGARLSRGPAGGDELGDP